METPEVLGQVYADYSPYGIMKSKSADLFGAVRRLTFERIQD